MMYTRLAFGSFELWIRSAVANEERSSHDRPNINSLPGSAPCSTASDGPTVYTSTSGQSQPGYKASWLQKHPATAAANHWLSWPIWAKAPEKILWERERERELSHSTLYCQTINKSAFMLNTYTDQVLQTYPRTVKWLLPTIVWLEVTELLVRPALPYPLHPLCPDGRTSTPQNPCGTGEDCLWIRGHLPGRLTGDFYSHKYWPFSLW